MAFEIFSRFRRADHRGQFGADPPAPPAPPGGGAGNRGAVVTTVGVCGGGGGAITVAHLRRLAEGLRRNNMFPPPGAFGVVYYGSGVASGAAPDPEFARRARELLLKNLNVEQAAEFAKDGSFVVEARDGAKYRICYQRSFNVKHIKQDGRSGGLHFCGTVPGSPIEDQMLAQKLLIENDPDEFFKRAAVTMPGESNAAAFTAEYGRGVMPADIARRLYGNFG